MTKALRLKVHLIVLILGITLISAEATGKGKLSFTAGYPGFYSADMADLDEYKQGPGFQWGYSYPVNIRWAIGMTGTTMTGDEGRINFYDSSFSVRRYFFNPAYQLQEQNENYRIRIKNPFRIYAGVSAGILKSVFTTDSDQQPVLPVDMANFGVPIGVELPFSSSFGLNAQVTPGYSLGGSGERQASLLYLLVMAGVYFEI